jgi:segregation and condensation protein A
LSDFLSVAAKLILIKSKALLPLLKLTDDEEDEIEDLTEKLREYKKFKEASLKLGQMDKARKISVGREGYFGVKSFFYPPENLSVFDLKKHFQLILNEIPIIEKLKEELVKDVVTLEEKISDLQKFLTKKIETSFSELISDASEKAEVIISFLAMLEMVKQRMIWVEQGNIFSEIKLKNR